MYKLLFFFLFFKTFGIKINLSLKNLNNNHLENSFNKQLAMKKKHINFDNYEGLVFEGGGTKGFCYPGIIQYLEQKKDLKQIQYLGGTSIGGIVASLVAFNFNSTEIENILIDGYQLLKSKKFSSFRDFYRLTSDFGLVDGQIFQEYFDQVFENITGYKAFTFKQLKNMYNKTLKIGSCCLTNEKFYLLDYQNNPDMPISLALRTSFSIPLVFTLTIWKNKQYVDGGVLGNLPLKSFPDRKCIAFCLKSDSEQKKVSNKPQNLYEYLLILFNIIINAAQYENGNYVYFSKELENVSIYEINTLDIKTLDLNINQQKINQIIKHGYKQMIDFESI